MFILDTSAIRAIKGDELQARRGRHDLRMSPWSFWELLSHLDEPLKGSASVEESFKRQKGQAAKCAILAVLEEPFAEHAVAVGAGRLVERSRFDDRPIIAEIIGALTSSRALDEFYQKSVTYPDQTTARLSDVAARVRNELQAEEDRYVAHVQQLVSQIYATWGVAGARTLSDADFVQAVIAPCRGLAQRYTDEGIPDDVLLGRVIDSLYLHLAYKLGRAVRALTGAGAVERVVVDPNDFEDGAISMHVSLTGGRVLVTGDAGAAQALGDGLARLVRDSEARSAKLPISCRVLGVREFLEATA